MNKKFDSIVNRAVEESEIKKQIEDLRRQRREIMEDIENTLRPYRKDVSVENEADAIPDDDDDDDDWSDNDVQLNWDYEETEEWDDDEEGDAEA